nr:DUF262 domain-containing protein [uncultured Psychroserpens sp.]
MKYTTKEWTVKSLIDLYARGDLRLNPPYQRNPVWSIKSQKELIDSIKIGYPLPAFFLHKVGDKNYDVVDGQQRSRTLLKYFNTNSLDSSGEDFNFKKDEFLKYKLTIVEIYDVTKSDYIEDFYYRVNKYGLRVNRPEEIKSKFFNTKFLELVQEIVLSEDFLNLELVSKNSRNRMLDRDLVEEIAALLKNGNTDKKKAVDKIYEDDLSQEEIESLKLNFEKILGILNKWNDIFPLKETRYRQRNDIYTIFGLLNNISDFSEDSLSLIYEVLLAIEPGILPNKSACIPLAEYAFNCISQSNSKKARDIRLEILKSILVNKEDTPNETQKQIIDYYQLNISDTITNRMFTTLNPEKLKQVVNVQE